MTSNPLRTDGIGKAAVKTIPSFWCIWVKMQPVKTNLASHFKIHITVQPQAIPNKQTCVLTHHINPKNVSLHLVHSGKRDQSTRSRLANYFGSCTGPSFEVTYSVIGRIALHVASVIYDSEGPVDLTLLVMGKYLRQIMMSPDTNVWRKVIIILLDSLSQTLQV